MTVSVRQQVELISTAAATSRTLTLPLAPLAGNTLILCLVTGSGQGATLPAGWTTRSSNVASLGNTYIWDRIAVGTDTGITFTQTSGGCVAFLYEIAGLLNPGSDVASNASVATSSTSLATAATAASTAANDWDIVCAGSVAAAAGVSVTSFTNLDLPIADQGANSGTSSNVRCAVGMGQSSRASGATHATTVTYSAAVGDIEIALAAYKIALTPPVRSDRRRPTAVHASVM